MCFETRGYINYNGRQTLNNKIWTITNKQEFTTLVLHLKNIVVSMIQNLLRPTNLAQVFVQQEHPSYLCELL